MNGIKMSSTIIQSGEKIAFFFHVLKPSYRALAKFHVVFGQSTGLIGKKVLNLKVLQLKMEPDYMNVLKDAWSGINSLLVLVLHSNLRSCR